MVKDHSARAFRNARLSRLAFGLNRELLRQSRELLNLKQYEVEMRTGLPGGKLTQYERGTVAAPLEHVRLLASFYNKPLHEIIDQTELLVLTALLKEISNRQ